MAETLRKLGLYLRSPYAYHVASSSDDRPLLVETGPLERYYLDQTIPLNFGHWSTLDDDGVPWRKSRDGSGYVHSPTTIAGYALGHLDMYLLTAEDKHLEQVINMCEYTIETVDRTDDELWRLREEVIPGAGHLGPVSGLDHAQWMSVLCRAWQLTDRQDLLDLAVKLLPLMKVPVSEGGILGSVVVGGSTLPWFEEETRVSDFHILNGMVCALWGLLDLATVTGDAESRDLWERGVESVREAMPLFDTGYWSWYGVSESLPDYISSMKYHGLHITQLKILGEQTGDSTIVHYADRFERYANRPDSRIRAGLTMFRARRRGLEIYRGEVEPE